MLIHIALAIALPLVTALLITPGIIRLASGIGALDIPNERKIHTHPVPRLGGIAVYASFFLTVALVMAANLWPFASTWFFSMKGAAFVLSLVLILLLGIWDDLRSLKPGLKFCVQALIATGCYVAGFRISDVTDPFNPGLFHLGYFDYPVTVIWIVGVTNAFNLIDGLDGLASGVGIIAALTIFMITLHGGDLTTVLLALLLAGSLLGFLGYNFKPARIFLGDSGSLFIGFVLALLSIQSSTKGSTAIAILIPSLALGLPIMDTLLSMARRLLGSFLPEYQDSRKFVHKVRSMFLPDRKHIHHQLLALGLSQRSAVLILYFVACLFGAGAFSASIVSSAGASFILVVFAVGMFAGIRRLHYKEMAIFRNGVLLPLFDWPIINRSIFQGFLDIVFSVTALSIAFYITKRQELNHELKLELLSVLPIVCGIQITVFYFMGLYRGTIRFLGIGDLLKIVRTVAVAVVFTSIASVLIMKAHSLSSVSLLTIDFYILLTLIAGSRISFHVLKYMFRKESKTGKRILIYGAGANGVLVLQQILNDDNVDLTPAGFLDDDPQLEGKHINGYEIFGGHWKLARILKKHHIDQVLISGDYIHPVALLRIKLVADVHGIVLKRPKMLYEDVSLPLYKRSERSRPVAVLRQQEDAVLAGPQESHAPQQKPVPGTWQQRIE